MHPETEPDHPPAPRRTGLVIAGALLALLAGAVIAWMLLRSGDAPTEAPPASQAGLVIESGPDDGRLDPAGPLRCFVAGQFVGELSLAECAQRNGVATDALDVGIDETGALAAADQAGVVLTPLPPEEGAEPAPEENDPTLAPPEAVGPVAACLRHSGGQWRRLVDTDLNGCVQALFAGRCERPGQATYGRFGQQTLRLVTGRVEISSDNQTFRTLVTQAPNCSVPPLG
ncbi:hypothetical protein ACO2Q0_00840 [Phenylobacterium sp. VNQ135]|uniref:hypothetical protein n=1 Tax=Phenylobacterium sp. VNQ135 TaxID=3400922 RepID=UPI003C11599A